MGELKVGRVGALSVFSNLEEALEVKIYKAAEYKNASVPFGLLCPTCLMSFCI
jgi:hypothetical protein